MLDYGSKQLQLKSPMQNNPSLCKSNEFLRKIQYICFNDIAQEKDTKSTSPKNVEDKIEKPPVFFESSVNEVRLDKNQINDMTKEIIEGVCEGVNLEKPPLFSESSVNEVKFDKILINEMTEEIIEVIDDRVNIANYEVLDEILDAKQEVVEIFNEMNETNSQQLSCLKDEIISTLVRKNDEEFEQNCKKIQSADKLDVFLEFPILKLFGINLGIKFSINDLIDKLCKKIKPMFKLIKSQFYKLTDKLKKTIASCFKHLRAEKERWVSGYRPVLQFLQVLRAVLFPSWTIFRGFLQLT